MTQKNGVTRQIVVGPDEGAVLPLLEIVHKVTAANAGGGFSIVEWALPPGTMIPPHTHTHEDECNFVLEGEMTCEVGDEIGVAPVGSYVVKPRGVSHALANAGTERLRVLEIHSPGAFETYYDAYEEIVARGLPEAEHLKARAELGAHYGVTWHDERITEVQRRLGLESQPS